MRRQRIDALPKKFGGEVGVERMVRVVLEEKHAGLAGRRLALYAWSWSGHLATLGVAYTFNDRDAASEPHAPARQGCALRSDISRRPEGDPPPALAGPSTPRRALLAPGRVRYTVPSGAPRSERHPKTVRWRDGPARRQSERGAAGTLWFLLRVCYATNKLHLAGHSGGLT